MGSIMVQTNVGNTFLIIPNHFEIILKVCHVKLETVVTLYVLT